jgi:hypothetical protein
MVMSSPDSNLSTASLVSFFFLNRLKKQTVQMLVGQKGQIPQLML